MLVHIHNSHYKTSLVILMQASFPDPRNKAAWNKVPCFPAKLGATRNLSYDQQANSLKKDLNFLQIWIKKVTHAWRVAGSRAVDAAGEDDNVCKALLVCDQYVFHMWYESEH